MPYEKIRILQPIETGSDMALYSNSMQNKIIQILSGIIILLCPGTHLHGNDSRYYGNGYHLVPLKETDISVVKEILSIELSDDDYINVDVYYEFFNPGSRKTITVGFESESPNNTKFFSWEGKHPFIENFRYFLNDKELAYRTGLVHSEVGDSKSFEFKALKQDANLIEPSDPANDSPYLTIWDSKNEEPVPFAYAYYCDITFEPGINRVRHSYKYRKSDGVGYIFYMKYLLTPALRWANSQIDDFTLRISVPSSAKHFVIKADAFLDSEFYVTRGFGKTRKVQLSKQEEYYEVSLRNGSLEWHSKNYKPTSELEVHSADYVAGNMGEVEDKYYSGALYDRTIPYPIDVSSTTQMQKRLLRNTAFAHRGYVFKDRELQEYFNSIWWYMPDPLWHGTIDDFTSQEKKLIKEILESGKVK